MLPGTACGMPYAPEYGLRAYLFQLLSRFHSLYSGAHCRWPQPKWPSILWPVRSAAWRWLMAAAVSVRGTGTLRGAWLVTVSRWLPSDVTAPAWAACVVVWAAAVGVPAGQAASTATTAAEATADAANAG